MDGTLNEIVTTGRHYNPNLLLKTWQNMTMMTIEDYFGGVGTILVHCILATSHWI